MSGRRKINRERKRDGAQLFGKENFCVFLRERVAER